MSFDRALEFALKWEGGEKITRDPIDPGGTTKYGISQRAYPNLDIESLTNEQAHDIYYRDYWVAGDCDKLPPVVGIAHFDACVNCGRVQAAKFLQRAVGVADDGHIGRITLQAVFAEKGAARRTILEREKYYRALVAKRPPLAKFLRGWLNRTTDLKNLVHSLEAT